MLDFAITLDFLKKYKAAFSHLNKKGISIEEFILINGEPFCEKGELGKDDFGDFKMCFRNAFQLMLSREDLFYVEGYAICKSVCLPLLHAWCVDSEGKVYDPTWEDGVEYYGVVFDRS